jgi:hypothetical protein
MRWQSGRVFDGGQVSKVADGGEKVVLYNLSLRQLAIKYWPNFLN